ncbi:fibronectin type III domain-containing protein [Cellulomonas citrea]|uniref:fibronectin type III domain-containing protein n=1 Tax=Cellulomonas citrea TaxID=1909423 RepID=UPI001916C85C|nr:fibronectin type III domain-containing protein [Cellulomonas citrea]
MRRRRQSARHAHRTSHRAPRIAAALAGALVVAPLLATTAAPASATPVVTVTGTSQSGAVAGTATPLTGVSVSGGAYVSATLSTTRGTLTFHDTSSATLAYGNHWSGDAAVTVAGTPADVDAALSSVDLVLPSGTGGQHADVTLTAYETTAGGDPVVYSPSNGHYYQYFPSSGIGWNEARDAAKTQSFVGNDGYLATIPDADVNQLVTSRIPDADNVWIGAYSIDDETDSNGDHIYRTWVWADGPLRDQSFTLCDTWTGSGTCGFVAGAHLDYSHWGGPLDPCTRADGVTTYACSEQPDNWNGSENVAVTNWDGARGYWNDLPPDPDQDVSGYVVEYGTEVTGGVAGLPSVTSTLSIVDVPGAPGSVSATAGDAQAAVSFTAPSSDGGSAVIDYLVTSSGGQTATCAASPCTVTGLTNGTGYTFTVTARNAAGSSPASGASASVTPHAVPAAPTVVGGTSSATVSWVASAEPGVTGYTVVAEPGEATCSTSSASATSCVLGAAAGVSTTYRVIVHSSSGDSAPSAASQPVTAAAPTVPAAPPASAPATLTTTQGVLTQVSPSQQLTVIGTGFAPYSTARVVIYSSPVLLAEVLVGADGTFSAPVTVPAGLEAGSHTLMAFGVDPQGQAHSLSMSVTNASGAAHLAATGSEALPLLLVALGSILLGVAALRLRSRRAR